MKIKYEVTGAFGCLSKGTIIDAYLLNLDTDNGIGLCYHPKDKDGCGSFEFIRKRTPRSKIWQAAFADYTYSNQHKIDPLFEECLKRITKFDKTSKIGKQLT